MADNYVPESDANRTYRAADIGGVLVPITIVRDQFGNEVIGSTTTSAVTSDTSGLMMGYLRGLVKWAFERMPASLGQKARADALGVALSTEDLTDLPTRGVELLTMTVTDSDLSIEVDVRDYLVMGYKAQSLDANTTITFYNFENSGDVTPVPIYDPGSNTEVSQPIAVNRYYSLDPSRFGGLRYLRFKFAVAQTGTRTVKLYVKKV